MRQLDLDQPVTCSIAPSSVEIQWNHGDEERTTILHTKRILEFGRESTCDICLRVEPLEISENKEKTLQISRRHFRLTIDGDSVQLIDQGSACGTNVDMVMLEPHEPFDLRGGETVTVADFLQLFVKIERENDTIQAVRFRRINNLPGTEYVCLIGQGVIGIGDNALLRLPLTTSRPSRSRTLDIGQEHIVGPPAMIFSVGDGIHIKRSGNEPVTVNQVELVLDQSVPFPASGVIQVGNSFFNIASR